MKTAYGGTHFFLVGMASTGPTPYPKNDSDLFQRQRKSAAANLKPWLCVAAAMLSYRFPEYRADKRLWHR
jgi:hypothetical protein